MSEPLSDDDIALRIRSYLLGEHRRHLPVDLGAESAIFEVDPPDSPERISWRILEDCPTLPGGIYSSPGDAVPAMPPFVDMRREMFTSGNRLLLVWHGRGERSIYFARMWAGVVPQSPKRDDDASDV